MPEPLKNLLNEQVIIEFANKLKKIYEPFNLRVFLSLTIADNWQSLELMQRANKIATTLNQVLPTDFNQTMNIFYDLSQQIAGILLMVFPLYISLYGLDEENYESSIRALEYHTKLSTSEFGVRPFIIKYPDKMMNQMFLWSLSDNEHVRRLASEGCRPALPWAIGLVNFKKDPTPIIPILENLKADPSLYVRKSVANNLNDISKTHPKLVVEIFKKWYGHNKNTDWIVKHAARTLLKKGNQEVLEIFGLHHQSKINILDFKLINNEVKIGDDLLFSFSLLTNENSKARLEYEIDFVKTGNKRSAKVFQISQVNLPKDREKKYSKKHSFADVSVRKHYIGVHYITLIINGIKQDKYSFLVK